MSPVASTITVCLTFLVLLQLIERCSTLPPFPLSKDTSAQAPLHNRINCSDCKSHITNRIRQMQHLERMKHRIMTAIKSKGNSVPQRGKPPAGPGSVLGAQRARKVSRGRSKSRTPLTSANGPKIVSFSRVVSSGKRKHVLQFTLNPAGKGANLEVVKAHLWLLLSRHHSHGNSSEVEGKDKVKVARKTKSGKESKVNGRRNRERTGRRSRRDLSQDEPGKTAADKPGRKPHRNSDENKNSDEDKDDDDDDEEDDDDDDDERFKTVLRVILVADNGTRHLMTYLRTKVKVTHWQKVRLPVSVIQQQLGSSRSTLTLMIRCGRCGGAVRMVLPKAASRSKDRRRSRRRGRKRKKKAGERDRKRRRKKSRERRHGRGHGRGRGHGHGRHGGRAAREGLSSRSSLRRLKENFHPSPFLVINTRVRRKKLY